MRRGTAPSAIAFTAEELDMLLFGLALIETDEEDAEGEAIIESARARIAAALPPEPAYLPRKADTPQQRAILGAIAAETCPKIAYTDGKGVPSERILWPIDLEGDMLAAWCEGRRDYRHFRLDRMRGVEDTGRPMPVRRRVLRAVWLRQQMEQETW